MLKDMSSAMGILRKLQGMHEDDMVKTLYDEAIDIEEGCANEHNDRSNATFFVLDTDKHIGVQIIPQWDYWVLAAVYGAEHGIVIKR